MDTLYQMIKRFIMAWVWWPFLTVTLVPFAIDGLIRRKFSQTNFDYPSPLAHRYSLYVMLGAVYLLFYGLNAAVSGATAIHTGRYYNRGFCLECVVGKYPEAGLNRFVLNRLEEVRKGKQGDRSTQP